MPPLHTGQSRDAPFIKPDPDLEPTNGLFLWEEVTQDQTDPDYLPDAGSSSDKKASGGFRLAHLQEAVCLEGDKFANFKKQINNLMEDCFDIRLTLGEQPDAMRRFKKTLLDEFPTVMDGDTESKMSLVTSYVHKSHGCKRHQRKAKQREEGCGAADMADDAPSTSPPSISGATAGEVMDAENAMVRGLRGLSMSVPAMSLRTEMISTPASPSSSQTHSRPLSFSSSSSKLLSFSDTSSINKRTTDSLSPPESPGPKVSKRPPSTTQTPKKAATRRRSPSIEFLPSPPAGISFPPSSAKRRKITPGTGTKKGPRTQSTRSPKSIQLQRAQPQLARPNSTNSPTKRRQTATTASSSSRPPTSSSSSASNPCSLVPSLPSTPSSTSSFDPPSARPSSEEIISLYSGSPALEESGMRFFLRSCKPSMVDFLPAFIEFGCTLPKLKAVSAWPPKDVDTMWVTKLREVVSRLRREQNGERQRRLVTRRRLGGSRLGVDETSMDGIERTESAGERPEMRELTQMDGIILGYHLKEFWKTRY